MDRRPSMGSAATSPFPVPTHLRMFSGAKASCSARRRRPAPPPPPESAKATSPTAMLPGIFLVYDFSAFMVEVTRHRSSLAHFLVRVCAIVGGVSTVVAFVDWAVVRAKRLYC